jgi:hypothetical protein
VRKDREQKRLYRKQKRQESEQQMLDGWQRRLYCTLYSKQGRLDPGHYSQHALEAFPNAEEAEEKRQESWTAITKDESL